jgi:hypothetical protein
MATRKKKSEAIVSPELQSKLDRFRTESQAVLDLCATAPLDTQADVERVDQLLQLVHATTQALEADRDTEVAPLAAELAAKRALYRPVFECLESCKSVLKARLVERNERSRTEVDTAVRAGCHASIAGAAVASTSIREQEYWVCEVVDESQIPEAYWRLDMNSLDKQASREKETFSVPGCRAVRRVRAVVR